MSADPVELTDEEQRAGSITRLPETLAVAAEALAASTILRQAMGSYLHDRVVAVRRAEADSAAGLSEETLVERYRWRY